ncbi:MAG: hypothetical protein FWE11_06955 [Defluviitaleaceae bacterium]|nr:hypothetical protein [Defluviitaleaceae bacterium]
MKQQNLMKALTTVLAMVVVTALLYGCGSDEAIHASTNNNSNTYQSTSDNSTEAPVTPDEVPLSNNSQTFNLTTINTTFEEMELSPAALSLEDAAQIGARYIQDIFGESIDGMYVELEFSDWEHVTRSLWNGAVSVTRRNTLEDRAQLREINEVFSARLEAGEDFEDVNADMEGLFRDFIYTPARFYFVIDAVTGQRINIWKMAPAALNRPLPHYMSTQEYIDREWDGDWESAFEAHVSPQEIEEISQLAMVYAQRHFNTTVVVDLVFDSAFAVLLYAGNGNFDRDASVVFLATDETGREAHLTFELSSRTLTSISTMNNDFIPFEFDYEMMEGGERFDPPREEEGYRSAYEEYPAERDDD